MEGRQSGMVPCRAHFSLVLRGHTSVGASINVGIRVALGGRNVSPRKGGTRLYVASGMSREATKRFEKRMAHGWLQSAWLVVFRLPLERRLVQR